MELMFNVKTPSHGGESAYKNLILSLRSSGRRILTLRKTASIATIFRVSSNYIWVQSRPSIITNLRSIQSTITTCQACCHTNWHKVRTWKRSASSARPIKYAILWTIKTQSTPVIKFSSKAPSISNTLRRTPGLDRKSQNGRIRSQYSGTILFCKEVNLFDNDFYHHSRFAWLGDMKTLLNSAS